MSWRSGAGGLLALACIVLAAPPATARDARHGREGFPPDEVTRLRVELDATRVEEQVAREALAALVRERKGTWWPPNSRSLDGRIDLAARRVRAIVVRRYEIEGALRRTGAPGLLPTELAARARPGEPLTPPEEQAEPTPTIDRDDLGAVRLRVEQLEWRERAYQDLLEDSRSSQTRTAEALDRWRARADELEVELDRIDERNAASPETFDRLFRSVDRMHQRFDRLDAQGDRIEGFAARIEELAQQIVTSSAPSAPAPSRQAPPRQAAAATASRPDTPPRHEPPPGSTVLTETNILRSDLEAERQRAEHLQRELTRRDVLARQDESYHSTWKALERLDSELAPLFGDLTKRVDAVIALEVEIDTLVAETTDPVERARFIRILGDPGDRRLEVEQLRGEQAAARLALERLRKTFEQPLEPAGSTALLAAVAADVRSVRAAVLRAQGAEATMRARKAAVDALLEASARP